MNLNDWTRFGGGFQGDSFYHNTDPNIVLKLFSENVDKEYVEHEFNMSLAIQNTGIKCPKVNEMVQVGNRYGIIFQRILNKKSFCRIAGENPEMIENLAERLSRMILEIQSIPSEGLPFPATVDIYRKTLEENTILDDKQRAICQKAIDEVVAEDKAFLVHGDFHFGNVITDGKDDYFIDLGSLSHGNPKFDIAMFYLVTHFSIIPLLEREFHVNVEQAMKFWNAFKKNYYGRDIPDEEIFASIKNYIILRSLWVLKDTGNAPFAVTSTNMFLKDDCPCESRDYI